MENKQTLAEKAVEQIAQEAAKKGQGKVDLDGRVPRGQPSYPDRN